MAVTAFVHLQQGNCIRLLKDVYLHRLEHRLNYIYAHMHKYWGNLDGYKNVLIKKNKTF